MKKNVLALFITVIMLLMISSVNISAQINETYNQTLYNNEEKPDLEIIDLDGSNGLAYILFGMTIMNKGNAPFQNPGGVPPLDVDLTIKRAYRDVTIYKGGAIISTSKIIYPGDTLEWGAVYPNIYRWGKYRVFFNLDPDQRFDDADYTNNKVYAYFRLRGAAPPIRISKLMYWSTGNEGIEETTYMQNNQLHRPCRVCLPQ